MHRWGIAIGLSIVVALGAACASSAVVPRWLDSQVDRNVTFTQVRERPDEMRGRIVVLGGEVLSAKRLKDRTRIEVLQLPLDNRDVPGRDRTASEGRFLAYEYEFLDPAKLPEGTRITVVGEVMGATLAPLDETEYRFPEIDARYLRMWDRDERLAGAAPYYRPYIGPYFGWRRWGHWGPYPYGPYWW